MKATLAKIHDESENIRTFYFQTEKLLNFTAGQFTELTLKHEHPDDRGERRWFTISSSPSDELVGITTRFAGEASSTFKKTLWSLQTGAEVKLAEAMGDFVLPKLSQTPLIFVAGGIGVTPFHSILSWLKDVGESRQIRFLWGVKTEEDIIFQDVIGGSGIHTTMVVSKPSASWGGERGRLSADLIIGLEKPTEETLIYISGPEPMVEGLEKELRSAGVNKRQIVTDAFPNYQSY